MNRRRILIALAVVALLIAAIATRGFGLVPRADAGALVLHGNVDIREVDMAFRVGGRIRAIGFDEGQKVKAGDLLATLDPATLADRAEQAGAQVAQAQARLDKLVNGNRRQDIAQARDRLTAAQAAATNAEQDYRRREPLVAPGAISAAIWQQTVTARDRARAQLAEARQAYSLLDEGARPEDIAAARADLAAAQAAHAAARTDLSDARLTAVSDGTVLTRAREPGAMVSPGETVLTLSLDRPLRVRAWIDETAFSRISPGMAVQVTADGNPGIYRGTIGYISPRAEFTPKSVETESLRTDLVYRLRILVADPDDALRQGQPVTVRVAGARPAHRD